MRLPHHILLTIASAVSLAGAATPEDFRAAAAKVAAANAGTETGVVKGRDGWYFLVSELRSYGAGPFWGADAAKAAVSAKDADPLPAILDFHRMLKSKGIALVMLPVPGKVCVYPDKLEGVPATEKRPDELYRKFYGRLAADGIVVIDLLPDLLAMRRAGTEAFCKQDSHWSPAAVRLAASKIADALRGLPNFNKDVPVSAMRIGIEEIRKDIRGDLAELAKDEAKESLTVRQIRINRGFAVPDPASPVVLMGDSHTLVYHKDLLADHAGLPDLLTAELSSAVDLVGVMGSGANGSRITLARRKDNLAGKKVVIWVFAAREFTESLQGWQKIPVVR